MTNILVFGDSITWGKCDKLGGWVQRLESFAEEKKSADSGYDCDIYNLGVSGDTVEDLLERVEMEISARVSENKTIVIFAIGINDSQISKSGQIFSLDQFRRNLEDLVTKSKEEASEIIFLGLTPVDDNKVDPIPWAPERSYRNEIVKQFNQEIKNFCQENSLGFIEIYDVLSKKNYKGLLEDGVHPNTEGHEEIFNLVKNSLVMKNLI